mmetsp:Transcript_4304/g.9297  ORF Transcript_4304/g.9297 Transcript_4304/m.9297 type:complete len:117 (-) Transcript_4304:456-806(-)
MAEASPAPPPAAAPTRTSTRHVSAKEANKENGERAAKPPPSAEVRQAVFDAHRQFITSCVEQLEVHTYMLSQAEHGPEREAGLHDYVMGLEALLAERQAALGSLQQQLQTFRATVG